MYGSYYYDFYFKEYSGMGIYCTKATKSLLHVLNKELEK